MARSTELVRSGGKGTVPVQFDLFGTDSRALTNTIALWDVAPRGVFRLDMARGEEAGPALHLIKRTFEYGEKAYQVSIAPAVFEWNGVEVAKFPGEREQLVEEVVRMLAVRGQRLVQRDEGEVGVAFTVYEIDQELERTGHRLSHNEIKESLNILHMSRVEIVRIDEESGKAKERVVSGSAFPMLVWGDRANNQSQTIVSFNWLVTQAMKTLSFRQIDYEKLMRMPGPIERWLYRYFAHDTLFFGRDPTLRAIRASEILDGCGIVMRSRPRDTYKRIVQALNALQAEKIIEAYEVEGICQGLKKLDVSYTIQLTSEFVKAMRRADQVAREKREDFKVIVGTEPKGFVSANPEQRKQLKEIRTRRRSGLAEVPSSKAD